MRNGFISREVSTGKQRLLAALSPLLLIFLCASAQYAGESTLGVWAWVPTMLLFWILIASFVFLLGNRPALTRWLQPPRQKAWWVVLGVAAGLLSLPSFVAHWSLLRDPSVLFFWLAFALVNPWFEEAYWRGLLMDSTASWGAFASVVYSTIWFTASHPLIWGVHAIAMRKWEVIGAIFLVGLVWAIVYQKCKSLLPGIAGHMLANLLGLSVPVLLNMYDPSVH